MGKLSITGLVLGLLFQAALYGQIYEEEQVPGYTLPPLLVSPETGEIDNTCDWETVRRTEILELFQTYVYGRTPGTVPEYKTEVDQGNFVVNALTGSQDLVRITFWNDSRTDSVTLHLLVILPRADAPVPLFLSLNALGNHTVHPNGDIPLTDRWVISKPNLDILGNRAGESSRGSRYSRWPVERLLLRGYGLATLHCSDMFPDYPGGLDSAIQRLFPAPPDPSSEWGALGQWAWGLSRSMDYLVTDSRIDPEKVIVIGQSRRGKAALWAGAQDERFAGVVSNCSGCGGAALSRRRFGETVKSINDQFPHWFCEAFRQFNDNEDELPVDQHMLLALVAPRLLYVASAAEDLWADPKGEFLSARHASAAYRLYGTTGLESERMPGINTPVTSGHVGYHLRSGEHGITRYDWERYMDFFDLKFGLQDL